MSASPHRISPFKSWQVLAALALLGLTLAWGLFGAEPVRSIVPYGLATALVSWRHGVSWGFGAAASACFVALAGGAFPARAEWSDERVGEGLVTFLKLSAVVIGTVAGKFAGTCRRAAAMSVRKD